MFLTPFYVYSGGCDSTLKAAEETDLIEVLKQGSILNKDADEETPEKIIEAMIKENAVAIFTKSFCPHCKTIKNFFANKGIAFKTLDLDILGAQGVKIQGILLDRTGQSTVPNVWINGKFIGNLDKFY